MSLKLISLNVLGNKHLGKTIPFFKKHQPDIICLQEALEIDLPLYQQKLNLKPHFFPLLSITKPNAWNFPMLGKAGLAILTNLPVKNINQHYYHGTPNHLPEMLNNPDAENRVLVNLNLTKDHQDFTIATTHFTWALPKNADKAQAPSLKKLLKILKSIPEFILACDLNAARGQKTFDTLASLYKDNIPQNITTTIDPNLHRIKNLNIVIDGLFTTPNYQATNVKVQCGLSDHCAIIAKISKIS